MTSARYSTLKLLELWIAHAKQEPLNYSTKPQGHTSVNKISKENSIEVASLYAALITLINQRIQQKPEIAQEYENDQEAIIAFRQNAEGIISLFVKDVDGKKHCFVMINDSCIDEIKELAIKAGKSSNGPEIKIFKTAVEVCEALGLNSRETARALSRVMSAIQEPAMAELFPFPHRQYLILTPAVADQIPNEKVAVRPVLNFCDLTGVTEEGFKICLMAKEQQALNGKLSEEDKTMDDLVLSRLTDAGKSVYVRVWNSVVNALKQRLRPEDMPEALRPYAYPRLFGCGLHVFTKQGIELLTCLAKCSLNPLDAESIRSEYKPGDDAIDANVFARLVSEAVRNAPQSRKRTTPTGAKGDVRGQKLASTLV